MHVTEQIAHALVETLRERVPALAQVYKIGRPPTGRRLYPVAVVLPGESDVQTQLSGNRRAGRSQNRTLQLGIAIRDCATADGVDVADRLTDIAAAVERALDGWDALPVDDVTLIGDSGVEDLDDEGADGVHAGIALNYTIRFFTVEGASDAFVTPDF